MSYPLNDGSKATIIIPQITGRAQASCLQVAYALITTAALHILKIPRSFGGFFTPKKMVATTGIEPVTLGL